MQLQTENGARMYIFDTFCKNQTPEERRRIDTEIVRIYNDILAREALRKLRQETAQNGGMPDENQSA